MNSPRIDQLRQRIVELIPRSPSNEETYNAVNGLSLNSLLCLYMNWIDRFIPPRRRSVAFSNGFWKRNSPARFTSQIENLAQLSAAGDDLTPYLSSRIGTTGYVHNTRPRGGTSWDNKDMALNAHDVHHLHLYPTDDKNRRRKQSDELLFVGVSRHEMVLVMLGNHKSFDDGSLFQAVTEFRASEGLIVNGIKPPRGDYDPARNQKLVRYGRSSPGIFSDNVVVSSMISVAGTSLFHTQHADMCCAFMMEAEEVLTNRKSLAEFLGVDESKIPPKANWEWSFWCGDLLLVDRESNTNISVMPWRR